MNAQAWADEFRAGNVVRLPFPQAGRSLIHERGIAAVAVLALLDDKYIGQTYPLTGPEVLTQADQVETSAQAIGKQMRIEELTPAAARQRKPRAAHRLNADVEYLNVPLGIRPTA